MYAPARTAYSERIFYPNTSAAIHRLHKAPTASPAQSLVIFPLITQEFAALPASGWYARGQPLAVGYSQMLLLLSEWPGRPYLKFLRIRLSGLSSAALPS